MKSTKRGQLFLLLSPPDHIMLQVRELKKLIRSIIGHKYESYHSKAHISILMKNFANANDTLYQIEDKLRSFKSFELVIKDFIVFHHGPYFRTICFDIVNKNPVREVGETVHGKEIRITPHITLAKMLSLEDFNKVWTHLQQLSYSNYFRCNHLTILKRSPYKWDPLIEIPFAN